MNKYCDIGSACRQGTTRVTIILGRHVFNEVMVHLLTREIVIRIFVVRYTTISRQIKIFHLLNIKLGIIFIKLWKC